MPGDTNGLTLWQWYLTMIKDSWPADQQEAIGTFLRPGRINWKQHSRCSFFVYFSSGLATGASIKRAENGGEI